MSWNNFGHVKYKSNMGTRKWRDSEKEEEVESGAGEQENTKPG